MKVQAKNAKVGDILETELFGHPNRFDKITSISFEKINGETFYILGTGTRGHHTLARKNEMIHVWRKQNE